MSRGMRGCIPVHVETELAFWENSARKTGQTEAGEEGNWGANVTGAVGHRGLRSKRVLRQANK